MVGVIRIAVVALVSIGLLAAGAGIVDAGAAQTKTVKQHKSGKKRKAKKSYVLKKGKRRCRRGYVKKRRKGKRPLCVKRKQKEKGKPRRPAPASPPQARIMRLQAHLDPNVGRNVLDPFEATYSYGASARQTIGILGVEEPAELPVGVLALYVDGVLECASNIGGPVTSDTCTVENTDLGTHRATTIFTSGSESATTTEHVVVSPVQTSTSLSVSYSQQPPRAFSTAAGKQPIAWRVGTVTIDGAVEPLGLAPKLLCRWDAPPGCVEPDGSIEGGLQVPIYVRIGGFHDAGGGVGVPIWDFKISSPSSADAWREEGWRRLSELEAGEPYLAAESPILGAGYVGSSFSATLQFTPTWLPKRLNVKAVTREEVGDQFEHLVTLGTYTKVSGPDTGLAADGGVESFPAEGGCRFQLRADGAPAALDDDGVEGQGHGWGVENSREFAGLPAGPVDLEIWVRYAGAEDSATCRLSMANYILSE